jgi:hypothetical protein
MLNFTLIFSQERQTKPSKMDKAETDTVQNLPPIELVKNNYSIATHVAIIALEEMEIDDTIYTDIGTLGYIIRKNSGKLLTIYKGDFGKQNTVTYYSFLEYSPNLEVKLDTVLVFLRKKKDRLNAVEVGEFPFSHELGKIVKKVLK